MKKNTAPQVSPAENASLRTQDESLAQQMARIEGENLELKKVVADLVLRNRTLKTRIERYKYELREMSRNS